MSCITIGVELPTLASIPRCIPECQNGGTCISPGVCACVAGWRGVRCQEGTAVILNYLTVL